MDNNPEIKRESTSAGISNTKYQVCGIDSDDVWLGCDNGARDAIECLHFIPYALRCEFIDTIDAQHIIFFYVICDQSPTLHRRLSYYFRTSRKRCHTHLLIHYLTLMYTTYTFYYIHCTIASYVLITSRSLGLLLHKSLYASISVFNIRLTSSTSISATCSKCALSVYLYMVYDTLIITILFILWQSTFEIFFFFSYPLLPASVLHFSTSASVPSIASPTLHMIVYSACYPE